MNQKSTRLIGLDLARAFAVMGMVLVNFKIMLGAAPVGGSALDSGLAFLLGLLEGRAAALFVVLAGVGMSLLHLRAESFRSVKTGHRQALYRRALVLFVGGLTFTPIWPADILHFYGLYLLIGTWCLGVSTARLLGVAGFLCGGAVLMLIGLDYGAEWHFDTLDYSGFWSAKGMIKHLFFNGFHPVFPWATFLLAGIWLGRQDLRNAWTRKNIFWVCVITACFTEFASLALIGWTEPLLGPEGAYLFLTKPMPPNPFYVISAGSAAIAFTLFCVTVGDRFGESRGCSALGAMGKLALTLYVGHVFVGIFILETMGLFGGTPSPTFATRAAVQFCIGGLLFSVLWLHFFSRGPLEWMIRTLTTVKERPQKEVPSGHGRQTFRGAS